MEIPSFEEDHFPKELMSELNNGFPVFLNGLIRAKQCVKCGARKFVNPVKEFICSKCREVNL